MKNKWFISALVTLLAIIGFSLEKSAVPNQEITLQFSDTAVTLDQAQEAITLIKGQLKTLDVDQIRIVDLENGTLKIKYYSDLEVATIEKIFSDAIALSHNLDKEDGKLPQDTDSRQYLLVVNKIQDSNDLFGAYGDILESKSEILRYLTLAAYTPFQKGDVKAKNLAKTSAYNAHRNPAIALENASYKIPEVRAGPIA